MSRRVRGGVAGWCDLFVLLAAGAAMVASVAHGQVAGCVSRHAAAATGWTSASSATGPEDKVCATTSLQDASLDLLAFGFALPSGATVVSIEVQVKAGRGETEPLGAVLILAGAEVTGLVKWTPAADPVHPPCTISEWAVLPARDQLGDDRWGRSWTPAELNSQQFGVRIYSGSESDLRAVDAVAVRVCYLASAEYAISVGPNVRMLLRPMEPSTDSSSWISYRADALGPDGTEIVVHVDSIAWGLTLQLYPSDLSPEDSSPYSRGAPLNLATARGTENAKTFIILGAPSEGRRATLNYVAVAAPEVPAGPLPPVTVTFTIRDRP